MGGRRSLGLTATARAALPQWYGNLLPSHGKRAAEGPEAELRGMRALDQSRCSIHCTSLSARFSSAIWASINDTGEACPEGTERTPVLNEVTGTPTRT